MIGVRHHASISNGDSTGAYQQGLPPRAIFPLSFNLQELAEWRDPAHHIDSLLYAETSIKSA